MNLKCLLNLSLLIFLFLSVTNLFAQTNHWAWQSGDTVANSNGSEYTATANIPSTINFPSAREYASVSADTAGNLWLFGGRTVAADYGKLWKYNTGTNEWTWLTGSSPDTVPFARNSAMSWIDDDGNFWLFGGTGFAGGWTDDFWKYDIATNKWINLTKTGNYGAGIYGTMGVASPDNKPGGRYGSVGWKDSNGNLWLFGGSGYGSYPSSYSTGTLNDLWKYNIASNEWTWVGGSMGTWGYGGGGGLYNKKGVASPNNYPGARDYATAKSDGKGTIWLFGSDNKLNDLWRYDQAANEWTWMAGDTAINPNGNIGVYGYKGVAANTNTPGYRYGMSSFIDSAGNFWIFGGKGNKYDISNPYYSGFLNDLWKFNVQSNEWIWIDGDSTIDVNRVYGARTIPASANEPGGREGMASCTDNKGQFWMFGGLTSSTDGLPNYLNDLWSYTSSQVLPVTLVSFTGKIVNQSAALNWTVSQSVNNKGFEIQKSKDGITFSDIGFVANTNLNTYTFTDVNLSAGTSLYRLKQIDISGNFTYSPVINIDYSFFKWKIINSSANTNAYVQLQLDQSASVSVQVITMNGSVIQSINKGHLEAGSYSIPLNIHEASSGLYIVRLMVNEKSFAKKIIINR